MKYLLTCFLMFLLCTISAQKFSVREFYENEDDFTATKEATKVVINYNELCALIKVKTAEVGFVFDGGDVGIERIDDSHTGEIWLYVPSNLSSISILHNKLGMLRDYQIPVALQPGHTYILRLHTSDSSSPASVSDNQTPAAQYDPAPQKNTSTQRRTSTQKPAETQKPVETQKPAETQAVPAPQPSFSPQWFVLSYEPKYASVLIDGVAVEGSDGQLAKMLSYGRHELAVSAPRHHTINTYIDIQSDKKEFSLKLKHAYGWLQVSGPIGASVYIDNERIGNAPVKSDTLSSGSHQLMVTKADYLPYKCDVLVLDDSVVTITPRIQPNFTVVNVTTTNDAEIWINDVMYGVGKVTVELNPGEYSFEARKFGCRTNPVVRYLELSPEVTINLPAPQAIYGSISVDAKPIGSAVYVDNEYKGESPILINNVFVGNHEVKVSRNDYTDVTQSVTVTEGEMSLITISLKKNTTAPAATSVPAAAATSATVAATTTKPASTPEPEPANTPEPKPASTPEPKPASTPAAAPAASQPAAATPAVAAQPAAQPAPQPAAQPAPQTTTKPTQSKPILNQVDKNAPAPSQVDPSLLSSRLNLTYIQEDTTINTTVEGVIIENGILNKMPSDFIGNYRTDESVKGIKDWAFTSCNGLTGITITENVRYIGKYVFKDCQNLKVVKIANGVSKIGENSFHNCTSLAFISFPASITSISDRLFWNCTSLKKVVFPETLNSIGTSSFYGCDKLAIISLPASLQTIGEKAFSGCSSLTSITIPSSVTRIGREAFSWCSNLNSITFTSNIPQVEADVLSKCKKLTTIYVPVGSKAYYQSVFPQELWPIIIEQ